MRLIPPRRRLHSAPSRRHGSPDLALPRRLVPPRPATAPTRRAGSRCARRAGTGLPARRRPRRDADRRRAVLLLGWLVVAGLLVSSSVARAETVQVLALAKSVDEVLTNIRNWIMGILAAVAAVFLTIGGLRYVMAAGDPGEIEKAKGSFKSAGIGILLAALAPLVVEILRGIVGGFQ